MSPASARDLRWQVPEEYASKAMYFPVSQGMQNQNGCYSVQGAPASGNEIALVRAARGAAADLGKGCW